VREPEPSADDLGDHAGGRRLPVRPGDECRPVRQPRGELCDGSGVERGEDLAGKRRAAPAREPREPRDEASQGDLEPKAHPRGV
jgi:hypothetical protein